MWPKAYAEATTKPDKPSDKAEGLDRSPLSTIDGTNATSRECGQWYSVEPAAPIVGPIMPEPV